MTVISKQELSCAVLCEDCEKDVYCVCHHCGKTVCKNCYEEDDKVGDVSWKWLNHLILGGMVVAGAVFGGMAIPELAPWMPEMIGLGIAWAAIGLMHNLLPYPRTQLFLIGSLILLSGFRLFPMGVSMLAGPGYEALARSAVLIAGALFIAIAIWRSSRALDQLAREYCGFIKMDKDFPSSGEVMVGDFISGGSEAALKDDEYSMMEQKAAQMAKALYLIVIALFFNIVVHMDTVVDLLVGNAANAASAGWIAMAVVVLYAIYIAVNNIISKVKGRQKYVYGASFAVHCPDCFQRHSK